MRIRMKALLAACATLSALVLAPLPAHGEVLEHRRQESFTNERFGVIYTCVVLGTTRYELYEDSSGQKRSRLYARTELVADLSDPACFDAHPSVRAGVYAYKNHGGRVLVGSASATSDSHAVEAVADVSGVATEVRGDHALELDCDTGGCFIDFFTAPK
jgi:hypothetical protein